MKITRRSFLAASAAASTYSLLAQQKDSSSGSRPLGASKQREHGSALDPRLADAAAKPVLNHRRKTHP